MAFRRVGEGIQDKGVREEGGASSLTCFEHSKTLLDLFLFLHLTRTNMPGRSASSSGKRV